MEPESPRGYATIVTCGLNRTFLRVRRGKIARKTVSALDRLVLALQNEDSHRCAEACKQLAELGSRSEEFTSMVRWFVEKRLGDSWEALKDDLGFPP